MSSAESEPVAPPCAEPPGADVTSVEPPRVEPPCADLPCVDLEHPNVVRVYDYYLGGNTNWAIDREFGKTVLAKFPGLRSVAMANRLFLNRTVRYLGRLGISQFIDVGSGVPTIGNTHEIADETDPQSRVVYLDNEPVAVAHSQLLLDRHGDPARHAAVNADLRQPDQLWQLVDEAGVLDLDRPVAMLLTAVLHIRQPGPDGIDVGSAAVARCRELLAPGSYLAISHLTDEGVPEESKNQLAALKRLYDTQSSPLVWRTHAEVRALLGDFELITPGMSWTPLWHPEETGVAAPAIEFSTPSESAIWAGVGKKR